jgi:TPR repeat protein
MSKWIWASFFVSLGVTLGTSAVLAQGVPDAPAQAATSAPATAPTIPDNTAAVLQGRPDAGTWHRRMSATQRREAIALLNDSCTTANVAQACLFAGLMQIRPSDPARDAADARRLFTRACTLREATGCVGVASILYFGEDGAPDRAEAERYLAMAVALQPGNAPAAQLRAAMQAHR